MISFNSNEQDVSFDNLVNNFFFSKFTPNEFNIKLTIAPSVEYLFNNPKGKEALVAQANIPFSLKSNTYSGIVSIATNLLYYLACGFREKLQAEKGLVINIAYSASGRIKVDNKHHSDASLGIHTTHVQLLTPQQVHLFLEEIFANEHPAELASGSLREKLAQLAIRKTVYNNEKVN